MKNLLFFFLALSFNALAVEGLTIPNSHQVDREGNIFRGREPKKLVGELPHIGITDVIIFKREVKKEVTEEVSELRELGIKSHHIPFGWKDFSSMEEACSQVVEAIKILKRVKAKNGKVFVHCTAGEDRTGMLVGLYRMLEEKLSREAVWKKEMCAHGYSDGNINKPVMVTRAIQQELTPLFIALAQKVESGEWKLEKITKQSCKKLQIVPTSLICRK